jgi:copper chaperone CopZ
MDEYVHRYAGTRSQYPGGHPKRHEAPSVQIKVRIRHPNNHNQKGRVKMQKATIQLETLTCPSCVQKIENATRSLDGVEKESVKVLFNSSKVKFDFDGEKLSVEDVEKAITALGYEVKKSQAKAK